MDQIIAQGVGFLAMAFNIGSYQIKNGRLLILFRMIGDIIYVLHYLLLGAYSGCITLVVCAANGLVCSFRGSPWAEWKGWKWAFSAALVAGNLLLARDSFRLLPVLCSIASILTVIWTAWSGSARIIRKGKLLVAGPTWALYCILVGSIPGLLCELVGMGSAAIALIRFDIGKRSDDN